MTKPLTIIKDTIEIKGVPCIFQLKTNTPEKTSYLRRKMKALPVPLLNKDDNTNKIGSITLTQRNTVSWPDHIEACVDIEIKDKAGKIINEYDVQIYWDAGEEEHMNTCFNL